MIGSLVELIPPLTVTVSLCSIDHALYLLLMIIMCPQRVQQNVTRDRDVAISGKQVMCAVAFTFRIAVQRNVLVL